MKGNGHVLMRTFLGDKFATSQKNWEEVLNNLGLGNELERNAKKRQKPSGLLWEVSEAFPAPRSRFNSETALEQESSFNSSGDSSPLDIQVAALLRATRLFHWDDEPPPPRAKARWRWRSTSSRRGRRYA